VAENRKVLVLYEVVHPIDGHIFAEQFVGALLRFERIDERSACADREQRVVTQVCADVDEDVAGLDQLFQQCIKSHGAISKSVVSTNILK
jgi:hypothetical protein